MSAVDLAVALAADGRPTFVLPDDFRGPMPSVEGAALAVGAVAEKDWSTFTYPPPPVTLPWREWRALAVELGERAAVALLFFGGPR